MGNSAFGWAVYIIVATLMHRLSDDRNLKCGVASAFMDFPFGFLFVSSSNFRCRCFPISIFVPPIPFFRCPAGKAARLAMSDLAFDLS